MVRKPVRAARDIRPDAPPRAGSDSMAMNSYTTEFLVWWKDFWVSTPGMNPSSEAKSAAWAAWQAGMEREQKVWGSSTGPNNEAENLRMQIGYIATELMLAGDKRSLPEIVEAAAKATSPSATHNQDQGSKT